METFKSPFRTFTGKSRILGTTRRNSRHPARYRKRVDYMGMMNSGGRSNNADFMKEYRLSPRSKVRKVWGGRTGFIPTTRFKTPYSYTPVERAKVREVWRKRKPVPRTNHIFARRVQPKSRSVGALTMQQFKKKLYKELTKKEKLQRSLKTAWVRNDPQFRGYTNQQGQALFNLLNKKTPSQINYMYHKMTGGDPQKRIMGGKVAKYLKEPRQYDTMHTLRLKKRLPKVKKKKTHRYNLRRKK